MFNFYGNNENIARNNGAQQGAQHGAQQAPQHFTKIEDHGPKPFVVDINKATLHNNTFRTALWTGKHLQLTLMSIPVGGDIGLEMHPNVDQFLRIEEGQGLTMMGDAKDHLHYKQPVFNDSAIFIPAGTWHNVKNTGRVPLKLYSIYAPPNHPKGTVHQTKAVAEREENGHGHGHGHGH